MADFTEKMRLKGKAEEDIYFAELDKKLIAALREKQSSKQNPETGHMHDKDDTDCTVQNN